MKRLLREKEVPRPRALPSDARMPNLGYHCETVRCSSQISFRFLEKSYEAAGYYLGDEARACFPSKVSVLSLPRA